MITGHHNDLYNRIVEYDKFNHLILNNGFDVGEDYEIFKDKIISHLRDEKDKILERLDELCVTYPRKRNIKTNIYGIKQLVIDYEEVKKKLINKFDSI